MTALALLLYAAALVVAVHLQVRHVEEPYLLATHGAAYAACTTRRGRFVPGVGRLTTPSVRQGAR